jgi:hypothetical protein
MDQRHKYKTIAQGAAASVWCSTHPMLAAMGGVYCEDVDIAPVVDANHKALNGVLPCAVDARLAQRLCAVSEEWVA